MTTLNGLRWIFHIATCLHSNAAVLYLFSPRCDPLQTLETDIRRHMFEIVGTPRTEYVQTWPQLPESRSEELIGSLSQIFGNAVRRWSEGSMLIPKIEWVNHQVVDVIIAQQYVVFYHNQTTRRDFGGFYGNG